MKNSESTFASIELEWHTPDNAEHPIQQARHAILLNSLFNSKNQQGVKEKKEELELQPRAKVVLLRPLDWLLSRGLGRR
jgi:hypothetical protein